MIVLYIDENDITDACREGMVKAIKRAKVSRSVDIRMRRDGQFHFYEADWIKYLRFEEPKPETVARSPNDGPLKVGTVRHLTPKEQKTVTVALRRSVKIL